MRDRPILFSGAMVHAILEGRKSQTRRVVKPQAGGACAGCGARVDSRHRVGGTRLWVREAFMPAPMEVAPTHPRTTRWNIAYAAGGQAELEAPAEYNPVLYNYERWTPSIFMPRWACRLVLEVTDVRVEKLQEISEADAEAEGVELQGGAALWPHINRGDKMKSAYRDLWDSLNAKRAPWASNPWVWVISFRRLP